MRKLIILGGGTAGTMMANKLAKALDPDGWRITMVDSSETHYYQPGFLFMPFGLYTARDVTKPRRDFLPPQVELLIAELDRIEAEHDRVLLKNGSALPYDALIIATGAQIRPDQTEGLLDDEWHKSKFDFYTVEGAAALRLALAAWPGGRLVVSIVEMPIKCPVAPLEFLFLADSYFTERGIRDKVDLQLVTPLPGAFTKPIATAVLGDFLTKRRIHITPEFGLARVDSEQKKLVGWDDTEIPYDLLVSIPTNMGDEAIARSGLGDELNFIPTDRQTLQSKAFPNIFVLGDATSLPASKAGSVAHFQSGILAENFVAFAEGRPMTACFDGHANCFIESGNGKGLLIDFNYDTEPLPGAFPLPGVGPFPLLEETKLNHFGKLMFRWIYWHVLLRGQELPIGAHMSMAGKTAGKAA
jgi:sulfide:quinone oxidoreductase